MHTLLLTIICCFLVHLTLAQAPFGDPGQHTPVLKSENTSGFGFYEYLPQDFDPDSDEKYPLLIFLHGLGENGNGENELSRVIRSGPPKYVENGEHFQGIIISPQHANDHWSGCFTHQEVKPIYDYLVANYPVDTNQVNLTGLSCGAIGGFGVLQQYPELFQKALFIAGNGNNFANEHPDFLTTYDTKLWIVHGLDDNTVGAWGSINPASALDGIDYDIPSTDFNKEFNGTEWVDFTAMPTEQMALTLYDNVGHNSWDRTYSGAAGLNAMEWLIGRAGLVTGFTHVAVNDLSPHAVPNPSTGRVSLENISSATADITIQDAQGHVLQQLEEANTHEQLDLTNYAAGLYLIHIKSATDSWTLRIMKTN